MKSFFDIINTIDIIWLIPIAFAIHEFEEWNILSWYKKHYKNIPESTNFSIHLHIIVLSIVCLFLIILASMLQTTFLFSIIIIFISSFVALNTIQHIVWSFQTKSYALGLITGLISLFINIFVNIMLICNNYILFPFYGLLLLIVLPLIKTFKMKREMTPEVRRVHQFFIYLEKVIKRTNKN
jgi:hypothetical protein